MFLLWSEIYGSYYFSLVQFLYFIFTALLDPFWKLCFKGMCWRGGGGWIPEILHQTIAVFAHCLDKSCRKPRDLFWELWAAISKTYSLMGLTCLKFFWNWFWGQTINKPLNSSVKCWKSTLAIWGKIQSFELIKPMMPLGFVTGVTMQALCTRRSGLLWGSTSRSWILFSPRGKPEILHPEMSC